MRNQTCPPVDRVWNLAAVLAITFSAAAGIFAAKSDGAESPDASNAAVPVIVNFSGHHPFEGQDLCVLSGHVQCDVSASNMRVELGGALSGLTVYTNHFGQFSCFADVGIGERVTAVRVRAK